MNASSMRRKMYAAARKKPNEGEKTSFRRKTAMHMITVDEN